MLPSAAAPSTASPFEPAGPLATPQEPPIVIFSGQAVGQASQTPDKIIGCSSASSTTAHTPGSVARTSTDSSSTVVTTKALESTRVITSQPQAAGSTANIGDHGPTPVSLSEVPFSFEALSTQACFHHPRGYSPSGHPHSRERPLATDRVTTSSSRRGNTTYGVPPINRPTSTYGIPPIVRPDLSPSRPPAGGDGEGGESQKSLRPQLGITTSYSMPPIRRPSASPPAMSRIQTAYATAPIRRPEAMSPPPACSRKERSPGPWRADAWRRSSSRQDEERSRSVECRAAFVFARRCWSFNLSPDSLVKDAVSQVTEKVLRNVVDMDERLGEMISISVLPSAADNSTVGDWAHRNMEQPPLIIVRSGVGDRLASQAPELDAVNLQRMVQEQTQLLVALQGQLNEQTAVIRNQATLIGELQSSDRDQAGLIRDNIRCIQEDVAEIKGQILNLEERQRGARGGGAGGGGGSRHKA